MRMLILSAAAALAAAAAGGCGTSGAAGAPASGDPCKTALLCDDFESYTAGQAPGGPWTIKQTLGSVVVDAAPAGQHSGAQAVRLSTQATTADGIKTAFMGLTGGPVFPAASGTVYGRMYYRLEAAPQASVHWTFIQGGGVVPGQDYHALYRYGGQLPIAPNGTFVGSRMMANYETPDSYSGVGPSSDCWQHAGEQTYLPTGAWNCVSWKFDQPNNQMTFALWNVPQADLTVNGAGQGCVNQPADFPWTAPAFDRLDLGWESYQTDDARAIWIDDVIISKTPLACPPAPDPPS
jgi:hypothetical protein